MPRYDELPGLRPLPEAKYLFLAPTIPRQFGGRTASMLRKAQLLSELGGASVTLVSINYSAELADISADLRRRGLQADGVDLVSLYDYFGDQSETSAEAVEHGLDVPGMERFGDDHPRVFHYFERGVYRLFQRFDEHGRLIVRDWFTGNRARTHRDEFYPNGTIRRTTYMDLQHDRPRQEVFFRADGTTYLNVWRTVNLGDRTTTKVERVTTFDRTGHPTDITESELPLLHGYLDRLIGGHPAFLVVESRRSDELVMSYQRPGVQHVAVLHNSHLLPPATDLARIRPSYRPALTDPRMDAVVFLTHAQRAEAEARLGDQSRFRVISHPVPSAPHRVPFEDRDPNLVVILGRLNQQKQLTHAVDVFAEVVKSVPDARLEIYGDGLDKPDLEAYIARRRMTKSVRLGGYTSDPDAVFQRAALSLLTSRYEGFGLVLLESLVNGCPVISYDVKYGPSDIVSEGVNGFLVRADDKQAMIQRTIEVLTDIGQRRRLSEGAAKISEDFSEEAFVARWSALFHDLQGRDLSATPARAQRVTVPRSS